MPKLYNPLTKIGHDVYFLHKNSFKPHSSVSMLLLFTIFDVVLLNNVEDDPIVFFPICGPMHFNPLVAFFQMFQDRYQV